MAPFFSHHLKVQPLLSRFSQLPVWSGMFVVWDFSANIPPGTRNCKETPLFPYHRVRSIEPHCPVPMRTILFLGLIWDLEIWAQSGS